MGAPHVTQAYKRACLLYEVQMCFPFLFMQCGNVINILGRSLSLVYGEENNAFCFLLLSVFSCLACISAKLIDTVCIYIYILFF